MRRRELLGALPAVAAAGCTIGGEAPSSGETEFTLSIPDLDGEDLPERYTCDGAGESPPLRIEDPPDRASTVAVVGEWLRGYTPQTIWLLWGVSAAERIEIPAGLPSDTRIESPLEARQGENDEGSVGYRSPCHETADNEAYRFIALALPGTIDLESGVDRDAFDDAVERAVSNVSSTTLRVRYERFADE